MKITLILAASILAFASCQKNVDSEKSLVTVANVSTDALLPMPCHSRSFTIDAPDKPGEVPPFRFTKTLYSDTRVKSIYMLSRANPIYGNYKRQAWELKGSFSYAPNTAFFKGTKELWEYYKTSSGAAAKRSIVKKNVSLKFNLLYDAIDGEVGGDAGKCYSVDNELTGLTALSVYSLSADIVVGPGSDEVEKWLYVIWGTNSYSIEPVEPGSYKPNEI